MPLIRKIARGAAYAAVVLACGALLFFPVMYLLGAFFSYTSGGIIARYPAQLQTEFTLQHLTYLPYQKVPACAVDGIISVEDKRFFIHPGIDPIAVVRVALASFKNDHQDHGGSTLTQQLARIIVHVPRQQPSLTAEVVSELRVLKYALIIEHDFSKDKILELYLNSVYYGRGAQGLAQAAKAYFHTNPSHLTNGQCFFLTGLPQAPTYYGSNPQGSAAQDRYLHVLGTLERNGYLSKDQEIALKTTPLFDSKTHAAPNSL